MLNMASIDTNDTSSPFSPLLIVALTILFWMLQPLVVQKMVIHRPRSRILLAIVLFTTVTSYLGSQLHQSLHDRAITNIKPMFFILLWYPPAMQFMRYLHALSVGGTEFAHHFGLTGFKRVAIFMLSVPTVQFQNQTGYIGDNIANKKQQHHDHGLDNLRLRDDVRVALMDLAIMVTLCWSILFLKLDILLPDCLQRVIRVYIMGFSTCILKLVLEVPCQFFLLRTSDPRRRENDNNNDDPQVTRMRIIPIYNRPYLTLSPRGLWHRWSVTAGYHLRKAFYEPLLLVGRGDNINKDKNNHNWATTTGLATAAPFLVNCILHITWWSIVVKGEMDYIYINLLFVYPLVSFWIQDVVIRRLFLVLEGSSSSSSSSSSSNSSSNNQGKTKSTWHHLANLALLWFGFYSVGESMSTAHAFPTSLTAVCRANIGL
jgi:hypothetical protein